MPCAVRGQTKGSLVLRVMLPLMSSMCSLSIVPLLNVVLMVCSGMSSDAEASSSSSS